MRCPRTVLSNAGMMFGGQGPVIGPWRLWTVAEERTLKMFCSACSFTVNVGVMELKLDAKGLILSDSESSHQSSRSGQQRGIYPL